MSAQLGIFAQGTRSHHHLEFDVVPSAEDAAVAHAIAHLHNAPVAAGGLNLVVGVGPRLWRRLSPREAPAALHDFTPMVSADGWAAPATQHDIWVWLHGTGPDVVLDCARAASAALEPVAVLATDLPGFVYHDSRDLTGFVDGTENPSVEDAPDVALLPEGQPGADGSFAITMQWLHNLTAFEQLAVAEQEAVIGRTKADSVKLPGDAAPPTAHIARVVIEDDTGEELEIYRRSVPYGSVRHHGLFFVAFSADPARFDAMLARMFGTSPDGLHDRLVEFSTPVSGSYYFVPSIDALRRLVAD